MTYERSILKSNPSPHVERLLNSAVLDVPNADSKAKAKAMALAALRQQQLGSTTQLSAFALGETATRLLGAVTLASSPVSSLRLLMRGAAFGAAVGAAALVLIVAQRWLRSPPEGADPTVAAQSEQMAPPPHEFQGAQSNTAVSPLDSVEQTLRAGNAMTALKRLEVLERGESTAVDKNHLLLLRLRCLSALGRTQEAEALAKQALDARPSIAQETALKAFLAKQVSKTAPSTSASAQ